MLIIAITLGIGFRFFHLDKKVYWHDEVYTSLRAAGFNRTDIDRELFQNQIIPAQQLQKYHPVPQKTFQYQVDKILLDFYLLLHLHL